VRGESECRESWGGVMMVALLLAIMVLGAVRLDGQTIRGRVTDGRGRALAEAEVMVRDSTETVAAILRTARDGRFEARLRRSGSYAVHVRRIGYKAPDIRHVVISEDRDTDLDIVLLPAVTELSPVTVRAQRDSIRSQKIFGMDLRTIAGYVVTPAEFEMRSVGAQSIVDVVRTTAPWVRRVSTGGNEECVGTTREGGNFGGGPPCLLTYVNGMRVDPSSIAHSVSLNSVDYVVLLRPVDAMTVFGAGAHNGVMLIYTKGAPKAP
jgi:hypothetical protein